MVLNTIVAQAISEICDQLEADKKAGKQFNASLQGILQAIIKKHKRVLFNGDGYTQEWHAEAKKRGLPNFKSTPEALEAINVKKNVDVMVKHGVLTTKEITSRYEINKHAYETVIALEGNCAATMARTELIPAAIEYQGQLAEIIKAVGTAGKTTGQKKMLKELSSLIESSLTAVEALEAGLHKHDAAKTLASMNQIARIHRQPRSLGPSQHLAFTKLC